MDRREHRRRRRADTSRHRSRAAARAGDIPTASASRVDDARADGSFTIGGLATGAYEVRLIVHDALLVNCPTVTLPSGKPYLQTLEPLTKRIAGRVLDALSSAPIPGATVVASTNVGTNLHASIRAVTDADGRFEVLVARVPASFGASAPGYGWGNRNVQVPRDRSRRAPPRSARVASRTRHHEGRRPRRGRGRVRVLAARTRATVRICDTADKDGRYALEELHAGEATLAVRGGGWASPNLADVSARTASTPASSRCRGRRSLTVDLVAIPSGRLEGKTVDAPARPVAGATVSTATSSDRRAALAWRLQHHAGHERPSRTRAACSSWRTWSRGSRTRSKRSRPTTPPRAPAPSSCRSSRHRRSKCASPSPAGSNVRVALRGRGDGRPRRAHQRRPGARARQLDGPTGRPLDDRPRGTRACGSRGALARGRHRPAGRAARRSSPNRPPVTIEGSEGRAGAVHA